MTEATNPEIPAAEDTADVVPSAGVEPEVQAQPEANSGAAFTASQENLIRSMIQRRDMEWQRHVESQSETSTNSQAAPAAEQAPENAGNIESEISSLYTDDDVGRATRRSVERHLELILKKKGIDSSNSISRNDVERIATEKSTLVRDQLKSGLTINQEVSDLINRGVIGENDAKVVQKQYSSALNSPGMKSAAENPKNAPWILKGVVYDLVKAGKIKPFSKPPRPTNPLTPGGSGANPAPAPISEDPSSSPFASIQSLSKEQLKTARNLSNKNYEKANL